MEIQEYNATMTQRIEVAPGLIIFRVRPDEPLPYVPGQYTVLGLKASEPCLVACRTEKEGRALIKRAMSIASGSSAPAELEFYVMLVHSGELTPRLFRLKPRSRLWIGRRAAGVYTLDRAPVGKHVFLAATGTGLAPHMAMLRSELECGSERRFIVVHGARHSWDLGYRAELETLAHHCPNLIYIPAISRPREDPTWQGVSGYIQDVIASGTAEERAGFELHPQTNEAFLCGNPDMVEETSVLLQARGFRRQERGMAGTIHTEEYW